MLGSLGSNYIDFGKGEDESPQSCSFVALVFFEIIKRVPTLVQTPAFSSPKYYYYCFSKKKKEKKVLLLFFLLKAVQSIIINHYSLVLKYTFFFFFFYVIQQLVVFHLWDYLSNKGFETNVGIFFHFETF